MKPVVETPKLRKTSEKNISLLCQSLIVINEEKGDDLILDELNFEGKNMLDQVEE